MDLRTEGISQLLSSDKRKSDRLTIPLGLFFLLPREQTWNGPFQILDIGGHGLKFAFNQELKAGTEFDLKITFPERTQSFINAKAKVAWCKLKSPTIYHIGAHITAMQQKDRRRYVLYICEKIVLTHLKKNHVSR